MIEIRAMADDYVLDRCPLGEPVDPSDTPEDDDPSCGERTRAIRRRFFREVRDHYGNCVFLAWDEGKVVGFLMFFPKPVALKLGIYTLPTRKLEDETLVYACMQFAPAYRGQGLGTRLVEALIAWAAEHGWRRIEVNNVSSGAQDEDWHWGWALPKWQRLGFEAVTNGASLSAVLNVGDKRGPM
jgi:GNAT superfamily N-acetyltransferase